MKPHIIASLLLSPGCNFFDPALYMNANNEDVSDTCTDAPVVPVELGESHLLTVATAEFNDTIEETCNDLDVPGNDGFFAIEAGAGEKWHFHLQGDDGTNPAVHVRQLIAGSCGDPRQCVAGVDACNSRTEHVTLFTEDAGTYVVGIDSSTAGGISVQVDIYRPECGNGVPEHSEPCDSEESDCNDCRFVVDDEERETNDDFTAANVLTSPIVDGRLDGCDSDWFMIEVPDDRANLTVEAASSSCGDEVFLLRAIDPLGDDIESDDCSPIEVSSPDAGAWHFGVVPTEMIDDEVTYTVTITIES